MLTATVQGHITWTQEEFCYKHHIKYGVELLNGNLHYTGEFLWNERGVQALQDHEGQGCSKRLCDIIRTNHSPILNSFQAGCLKPIDQRKSMSVHQQPMLSKFCLHIVTWKVVISSDGGHYSCQKKAWMAEYMINEWINLASCCEKTQRCVVPFTSLCWMPIISTWWDQFQYHELK